MGKEKVRSYKKMTLHYLHYLHFGPRKCKKCRKCKAKKWYKKVHDHIDRFDHLGDETVNMVKMVNTKNDVRKVRNVRILKIITILSANFYTSGKIGRGFFISVQNYQKWFQKFCYLSQRTQRKQNCTYIKNARETMGLWKFKVS